MKKSQENGAQWGLWIALVVVLAFGCWHAWSTAFVQDDAYITFRYAKNWLAGHGLVYNPGEAPVEGYSNLLWMWLVAAGMRLGVEPDVASKALGLLLFPLTLILSFVVIKRTTERPWLAVGGVFLLGLNYTFAGYATGGLETQLQCALGLSLILLADSLRRQLDWAVVFTFVVTSCLAMLCRLDSALIIVVSIWYLLGGAAGRTKAVGPAIVGSLGAFMAVWTLWRLSYYGAPLPNTFYVKAGGLHILDGAKFYATFCWAYFVGPFHVLLLVYLWIRDREHPLSRFLIVLLSLWCLYVLWVGGDFMEFRFMVVMMPIFAALLMRGFTVPKVVWLSAASLICQFLNPKPNWGPHELKTNSSIPKLAGEVSGEEGWVAIGKKLHELLGPASHVKIGINAAGAIPYYSELDTVDMLALNDRDVTQRGLRVKDRPGHEVKATVALLKEKGVNLVISHPQLQPLGDIGRPWVYAYYYPWHFRADKEFPEAFRKAKLVSIPISPRFALLAWYLTPSPELDKLIAQNHWHVGPASAP